jgi:aminoglycoside/choline kinase family phosphotransferase
MRCMSDSRCQTDAPLDPRLDQARTWLLAHTGSAGAGWQSVAGDASFRRYFRVELDGESRILMDAPPDLEDSSRFLDIAARLRSAGLHAPKIFLGDLPRGFLLLEDLGDDLYRQLLSEYTVDDLFAEAFDALATMAMDVRSDGLPRFGVDLFARELQWFLDHYLASHRTHSLDSKQRAVWQAACERLVATAERQPQVFVHKDVHSCNLLRTRHNSPGIIDFQDAVVGPLTYDFVSLIWDRYIAWPRPRIEGWMEQFRQRVAPQVDSRTWVRWCDLMGLQRNLKIIGRFALLRYEHGRQGYIEMIPQFYGYVTDTLRHYPEFDALRALLEDPRCAP